LAGLIDLFRTTADVLHQTLPDDVAEDSFSLLPILRGTGAPVRTSEINHSIDGYFAIREGNWKLELCAGSGGWGAPREAQAVKEDLPNAQLYELGGDPAETHNVASAHPDVVERLTRLLEKAIADGRTAPGKPQKNDVAIKIHKVPKAEATSKGAGEE